MKKLLFVAGAFYLFTSGFTANVFARGEQNPEFNISLDGFQDRASSSDLMTIQEELFTKIILNKKVSEDTKKLILEIKDEGRLLPELRLMQLMTAFKITDRKRFENVVQEIVLKDDSDTYPVNVLPSKKMKNILYTLTDEGIELPILDLTNKAFKVDYGPHDFLISLTSMFFLCALQILPANTREWIGEQSWILRDFFAPKHSTFLNGLPTYWAKLGSKHIANFWDKMAAGSKQSTSVRFRLETLALLQAEALIPLLNAASPQYQLIFVNIGGGTAYDSINTILNLQKSHPDLIKDRKIVVNVLDINVNGFNFGKRSLTELTKAGAPLAGVDVELRYVNYDWSNPSTMLPLLEEIKANNDIGIATSEGGLFEYGDTKDMLANLKFLNENTSEDFIVAGSFYLEKAKVHPCVNEMLKISDMGWNLIGEKNFSILADEGNWRVEGISSYNDIYRTFVMVKK